MKQTIHTGHRKPRWWAFILFPWLAHDKKSVSRKVTFGLNCVYDLEGEEDDLDVNKIFGLGYLWNKDDSARFGWNYNNITNRVDLFAYYHVNGLRDFTKICSVSVGLQYLMILNINDQSYSFSVASISTGDEIGNHIVIKTHKKKWSYNMGMYFGGTLKAPHDITIEINKV